MVVLVLLMQVVFLALIIKSKYETNNFISILLIVLITLIIIATHQYLDLHHDEYSYEKITVVVWVPIGAVICYLLNIHTDFGSVLSAGIVGTLASFIPLLNKKSIYLSKLPSAIYCGVFVGMSSVEVSPSIKFVVIAGIIAGIVYLLSKNLFVGLGGKLGTIAFVSVGVVTLFNWFLS